MINTNSVIYTGKIKHTRVFPKRNAFTYSAYMMYIDLDELPKLNKQLRFFSWNRFNIFSFCDKDHFKFIEKKDEDKQVIAQENVKYKIGDYQNKDIKSKIDQLLKDADINFKMGKVFALTNLSVFGYVFNPVTFYYCFDTKGVFSVLVCEVNNTFGDQKIYFVPIKDPTKKIYTSLQRKNFYISPYTKFDNDLSWELSLPDEKISMVIDSQKKGKIEISAVFTAEKCELNDRKLLYLQFRYPLYSIMILFRIHYQALKLYIKKIKFRSIKKTDQEIVKAINKK